MALEARSAFWDAMLDRALKMPQKNSEFIPPEQLYEANSQKWVRKEPTCLSDFTARPVIFDLCEPVKDAVILDLGCGEGYCSRELMSRGAKQVIGVDISTSSIAAAQAEEDREPLDITYLAGDSTNIRKVLQNQNLAMEKSGTFDTIVAVFLFNYLTIHEMVQCMKQVKQLLKPGGRFIFSIPHPSFAFLSKPQNTFHFELAANGNSNSGNVGYFSARDRLIPGKIARRDGTTLPVQVRHKTLQDYFEALAKSGFATLPQIQELKVTDSHLQLDPNFFGSLADVPLHMAFSVTKQEFESKPSVKRTKAIIKDVVWSQMFGEEDYCFQIHNEVLAEFDRAHEQLKAKEITWRNYEIEAIAPVIVITIGGGLVLKSFGVDLTGIWVTLGGATFIIGFAIKDILANFFSGIVLLIDTPFQFGDVLRLEDGSLGMLKKIGVRVTQLYMFNSHCDIYIPNSTLQEQNITNLSRPTSYYYYSTSIQLPIEWDMDRAKQIIEEIILAHPDTLGDIDRKLQFIEEYYRDETSDIHESQQAIRWKFILFTIDMDRWLF